MAMEPGTLEAVSLLQEAGVRYRPLPAAPSQEHLMRTALLWLFVINLGIAFGAGLYEHRIVVPEWIGPAADGRLHWNPDAARSSDTGLRFWVYVTTVPLTLLTLANLVAAWRARPPARGPWLSAGLLALADRAVTFAYFIPTLIVLMGVADSPESAARAQLWSQLNYGRHLLVFGAWMAALVALTKVGSAGSQDPAYTRRV